jgi:hypothetical protein
MGHTSLRHRILLTSVFAAIAAVACTENQSDGTSKSDAGGTRTTTEQGGQAGTTSNGTSTGGTAAGGAAPVVMGGTSVGGALPASTGGAAPVSAGGTAAGGATPASNGGAAPASTGGTAPTSTGGVAGGGSTLPQCPAHPRRDITVRLALPDGMTAPTPSSVGYGGVVTNQVDGTLQAITEITESCPACTNGTRQALSIPLADDQARTFTLVAYPVELVTEWAAAVNPLVGQRLSLMFRYTRNFQYNLSTGFVLSDAAGPVIAAEQAQFVTALKPADLPGFTVTLGEPICGEAGVCATNVFRSLVFAGTTSTTVGLTEDGSFTISSQGYGARNLGAGTLGATTCADLERASPWSIWRVSTE